MAEAGATVSTMPEAEIAAWVAGMPDVGATWIEAVTAQGLPGAEIMSAFMNGAREKGAEPLRNWDQ